MSIAALCFDEPPYRLSGTVYAALLNHRSALDMLGESVHAAPYKAPPNAPVLGVKPRNTLSADGEPILVDEDAPEVDIRANLGIVIGRTACRVSESSALDFIAGFLIVNDVSLPFDSHYRPNVRFKARDGFCPLGPRVVARASIALPDALGVRVSIDGRTLAASNTSGLIRPVARLLADVSEFMTLSPGDVLAAGAAAPPVRARAGQEVCIEIDGLGALRNRIARRAA